MVKVKMTTMMMMEIQKWFCVFDEIQKRGCESFRMAVSFFITILHLTFSSSPSSILLHPLPYFQLSSLSAEKILCTIKFYDVITGKQFWQHSLENNLPFIVEFFDVFSVFFRRAFHIFSILILDLNLKINRKISLTCEWKILLPLTYLLSRSFFFMIYVVSPNLIISEKKCRFHQKLLRINNQRYMRVDVELFTHFSIH